MQAEGCAIVALVFEGMFVDETLVDVFDAVLISKGHEDLVASSRLIRQEEQSPVRRLGKPTVAAVYSPFSFRQILEFIIFLPLNFIPVVGVPIFLLLSGVCALLPTYPLHKAETVHSIASLEVSRSLVDTMPERSTRTDYHTSSIAQDRSTTGATSSSWILPRRNARLTSKASN